MGRDNVCLYIQCVSGLCAAFIYVCMFISTADKLGIKLYTVEL